jgi:hypothetical protein
MVRRAPKKFDREHEPRTARRRAAGARSVIAEGARKAREEAVRPGGGSEDDEAIAEREREPHAPAR